MTHEIAKAFGVDPLPLVPIKDEGEGECPNCKVLHDEIEKLRKALGAIAHPNRTKTGMKELAREVLYD